MGVGSVLALEGLFLALCLIWMTRSRPWDTPDQGSALAILICVILVFLVSWVILREGTASHPTLGILWKGLGWNLISAGPLLAVWLIVVASSNPMSRDDWGAVWFLLGGLGLVSLIGWLILRRGRLVRALFVVGLLLGLAPAGMALQEDVQSAQIEFHPTPDGKGGFLKRADGYPVMEHRVEHPSVIIRGIAFLLAMSGLASGLWRTRRFDVPIEEAQGGA